MLYFPKSDQENGDGLGTDFYGFNPEKIDAYENFENIHNDNNQFPDFDQDSKVTYSSRFEKNNLVGFSEVPIRGTRSILKMSRAMVCADP